MPGNCSFCSQQASDVNSADVSYCHWFGTLSHTHTHTDTHTHSYVQLATRAGTMPGCISGSHNKESIRGQTVEGEARGALSCLMAIARGRNLTSFQLNPQHTHTHTLTYIVGTCRGR